MALTDEQIIKAYFDNDFVASHTAKDLGISHQALDGRLLKLRAAGVKLPTREWLTGAKTRYTPVKVAELNQLVDEQAAAHAPVKK